MAVPRRRRSKAKRDRQRLHKKLSPAQVIECPECKEPTLPHRVCPSCGTYKGKTYKVTVTK